MDSDYSAFQLLMRKYYHIFVKAMYLIINFKAYLSTYLVSICHFNLALLIGNIRLRITLLFLFIHLMCQEFLLQINRDQLSTSLMDWKV